jgi:ribonuclease Z
MNFELTFLGTNSALPAHGRFPSAQVLAVQEQLFLIDCGEGTQARMLDYHVKRHKINQVFISHLHGDHVFGLIGLLTTLNLMGRENKLDIFSPKGLEEVIHVQLRASQTHLGFPIDFHVVDTTAFRLIFENETVAVYSIPLLHRIPTNGFLFREKERLRNIRSEKIEEYELSVSQILAAKEGKNISLEDGRVLPNTELTKAPPPPRSYAYCSDTLYTESILPYIKGVDLLYHESTFIHDNQPRARETMHSTALEAATMAKKAEVKMLFLGHFSSRHKDVRVFEEEALRVFPHAIAAREGMQVSLPYHHDAEEIKITLKDPE